jgi:Flp pilus assembly protein protease CpaA
MQYYLLLLFVPFLYFNYKIVLSDLKFKKIPNQYLGYLILLLPFYCVYFFYNFDLNIWLFIFKYFLSIIISFLLYYYWVWSAWDAKYLLVLSLFVPWIWIIPFIWNIAILTLLYLIIYFIYFYIIKIWTNKNNRKSFFKNLYIDNKEKLKNIFWYQKYIKIEKKIIFYKLLKSLLFFLTIFVIIRLTNIYLIEDFKGFFNLLNKDDSDVKNTILDYIPHIIWLWVISSFILIIIFKKIYTSIFKYFMKYFIKYLKIDVEKTDIWFWFLLIILSFLIIFVIYEYLKTGFSVLEKLYLIFTLYLWLYLLSKIFVYLYKTTFQLAEQEYVNINTLKWWEIVDKNELIKLFWNQECLSYLDEKKDQLYHNPKKYLQNINNPIDESIAIEIQKIYETVNTFHLKNKTPNFRIIDNIKILKTFAFSQYIFIWFLITFFIQDKIFKYLFNFLFEIIKNIYS